jgi:hypothetical protein
MTERSGAFDDVVALMQAYFEGLYRADSAILATIFDGEARYVNATPGDPMNHDMPTYFCIVDSRTSPADRGDRRDDRIVSITFGGDAMAFVVARMTMMGRDYLDYLTLIRADGRWRIVAKVFFHTEKNEVP